MYIVLKIVLNNCSIEVTFYYPLISMEVKPMRICKNEQVIKYLDKTYKSDTDVLIYPFICTHALSTWYKPRTVLGFGDIAVNKIYIDSAFLKLILSVFCDYNRR